MWSISAAQLLETLKGVLDAEPPPSRYAVAYSGGRDSGVLLWALCQLVGPGALTALHVDHGWRPQAERDAEAALVEAWCRTLGVALVRFPAPSVSRRTEASAREHRYGCFADFLRDQPQGRVYLAHHADDQAETVLMRLLRGRSWQGLAGIPARRGPYRRPFLSLRASLIAEVAREVSLPFHNDSTNTDRRLARNLLRQDLLPLLQGRFPRAIEALGEFASVWSQAAPFRPADRRWVRDELGGRVDAAVWDQWMPLERQAQLLSLVVACAPTTSVTRRFLETVCTDGRRASGRGRGWLWRRTGQTVWWTMVAAEAGKEYFIRAEPGVVYFLGSYQMVWVASSEGALFIPGIDPDRPWVWRSALPGMRISSRDDADWGKTKRKRRWGGLDPTRAALVFQGGHLRAVVDPQGKRLVWAEADPGESLGEKLNKRGIFVRLISVTRNATE